MKIPRLTIRSRPLSSSSWRIEPFSGRNTTLNYAATHHPAAPITDFGGPHAHSLEVVERLKAISPSTSLIISVKVHRGNVRKMLKGTEMVNLIKQCRVEALEQSSLKRSAFSQEEEINLDGCV